MPALIDKGQTPKDDPTSDATAPLPQTSVGAAISTGGGVVSGECGVVGALDRASASPIASTAPTRIAAPPPTVVKTVRKAPPPPEAPEGNAPASEDDDDDGDLPDIDFVAYPAGALDAAAAVVEEGSTEGSTAEMKTSDAPMVAVETSQPASPLQPMSVTTSLLPRPAVSSPRPLLIAQKELTPIIRAPPTPTAAAVVEIPTSVSISALQPLQPPVGAESDERVAAVAAAAAPTFTTQIVDALARLKSPAHVAAPPTAPVAAVTVEPSPAATAPVLPARSAAVPTPIFAPIAPLVVASTPALTSAAPLAVSAFFPTVLPTQSVVGSTSATNASARAPIAALSAANAARAQQDAEERDREAKRQ